MVPSWSLILQTTICYVWCIYFISSFNKHITFRVLRAKLGFPIPRTLSVTWYVICSCKKIVLQGLFQFLLISHFSQPKTGPSQAVLLKYTPLHYFLWSKTIRTVCNGLPVQELIVIDDLLSALVGIEGRYISIKMVQGKEDSISFQVDPSMDLTLQVRILSFLL